MLCLKKRMLVSYADPGSVTEYFEHVNVFINAHGTSKTMHKTVVAAHLGEIPFRGTSPVNLNFR